VGLACFGMVFPSSVTSCGGGGCVLLAAGACSRAVLVGGRVLGVARGVTISLSRGGTVMNCGASSQPNKLP